jgi:hypothetical protein
MSFWTPKTTIVATVVLVFTVFGFYLIYQYRILTGPPYLEITYPPQDFTSNESSVEIQGVTDPEATISVNNQLVALDKGGTFSLRVPLVANENKISIQSTSKSGKTTTIYRTVNLTPAP